MDWISLFIAATLEIIWAIGLKYSDGFTKLVPSVITLVTGVASLPFLSYAMRTIPAGTAYAIWTGVGACGIVMFGMIFLGESRDYVRLGCLLLIFLGIAGLKLGS